MAKVYPVPEVILSDRVDIREGTGSMDNENRVMRVPLSSSPAARHVRAHEMAHAKYSPKSPTGPKGVAPMAIQRAEDMRMNLLCRRNGLDDAMDAPICDDGALYRLVDQPLGCGERLPAVSAAVSGWATGDYDPILRVMRSTDPDLAERVAEFVPKVAAKLSENPTWSETLKAALAVCKFADDPESEEDPMAGWDGEESGDPGESGGEPLSLSDDELDGEVDRMLEVEAKAEEMAGLDPVERAVREMEEMMEGYSRGADAELVRKMRIVEPKLPLMLPPAKTRGRAPVPSETGRVPRYMGRYCTDRNVFVGRGKRRDRGGAVLIDCSGSMSLSSEDVDAIMEAAPAGIIAAYSGHSRGGELWIVARNGRRAKGELRPEYRNNVIDVPALEWLAKQEGPRYWICDGIVTGAYDRAGDNITEMCATLCRKNQILRVRYVEELVEAMHR